MRIRLKLVSPLGAFLFTSVIAIVPAAAQSPQRGGASESAPTTILGPAMLRPGTAELTCGTGPAGLGPFAAERIEQTLSLDAAQRTKFNNLKTASQKALQYLNESCPKNDPVTPTGRLKGMEQRLAAMLEAVRTVEPALDDFYAALTDEQKARLNAIEPAKARASAPEPARTRVAAVEPQPPQPEGGDESPDVDRRGHGHHRHGHGHRHFGFRLRLPIPF
jgi:hypothetical protein